MGGEKSGAWWIIILFLGSPPHRRGKEYDDPTQNELIGITPAWAGKRCCSCRCSSRRWDHPRTGGEKLANIGDDIGDDGFPLLVQKLFNFTLTHDSCGIFWCFGRCFNQLCNQLKITVHFRCCHFIHVLTFFLRELPLHGRERPCKHSCNSPCPDYSRLCGKILRFRFDETFFSGITPQGGEKSRLFFAVVTRSGSPPRGRGKGLCRAQMIFRRGITPAWAGKSELHDGPDRKCKDHPRVGGEKYPKLDDPELMKGSPPRGRGKGCTVIRFGNSTRITPAWAGKRAG